MSWVCCSLWLWHSLDVSMNVFESKSNMQNVHQIVASQCTTQRSFICSFVPPCARAVVILFNLYTSQIVYGIKVSLSRAPARPRARAPARAHVCSYVVIVQCFSFDRACRYPPHFTNGSQWIINGSLPLSSFKGCSSLLNENSRTLQ